MTNKKVEIIVREGTVSSVVTVESGITLLDALRRFGKGISAPCGGGGTCGKCEVDIADIGIVRACRHRVDKEITVTLPEDARAQILHDHGDDPFINDNGITSTGMPGNAPYSFNGTPIHGYTGDSPSGVAIDIGTTTVVVFLADLSSGAVLEVGAFLNPQRQFGHDVVSRIQHAMTRPEGLGELRDAIIGRINAEIATLCADAGRPVASVVKCTVVGNPTMAHIFCNVDPSSIAVAPYTPVFTEKKVLAAAESGLAICPDGVVIVLPAVSGYVGADITAGLATTPITHSAQTALYIDIGTNGEMALGNKGEISCCATAAGPAFEGATIQCGVGGIEGAISVFTNGTYRTIGNKPPVGICGSGLVDITAWLLREKIVDEGGYMEKDFLLESAAKTTVGTDIVLTPQDIRQVQLAKAAIAGGIGVLMKDAGLHYDDIEALYIGGAFGNFMNMDSAAAIGLIPVELRDKVVTTGNVAGRGALSALLSVGFERRVDEVGGKARYIELSTNMDFMDFYICSMNFGTPTE